MIQTRRLAIAAGCVLSLSLSAFGQQYHSNDLTPPQALYGTKLTSASKGKQVGSGDSHAYLLRGNALTATDLNPTGYSSSRATASDDIEECGYGWGPTGYRGLKWTGTAASAVALQPPSGYNASYCVGVDNGQEIGFAENLIYSISMSHAMYWNGTAAPVDLHPANLYPYSRATGIKGGEQVGYVSQIPYPYGESILAFHTTSHAYKWNGDSASAVDLHPAQFDASEALATNGVQQGGWGYSVLGTTHLHAVLWSGTAQSAVDLSPAGFTDTKITAMSGTQQVGDGWVGTVRHALLWTGTADSVVDLNQYLPAGYTHSVATGIDPDGNVVGYAYNATYGVGAVYDIPSNAIAVVFAPGQAPVTALSSFTLSSTAAMPGDLLQATVTLGGAAPAGGVALTFLSTNTALAATPLSVVIPEGSSSVAFPVPVLGQTLTTPQIVKFYVTDGAGSQAISLTITPVVRLMSVVANPVEGGFSTYGTVNLSTLGQARFYSGDYKAALSDFQRSLQFARDKGDHEAEVTRLNNIGNTYYAQGMYGEALHQYQLADVKVQASKQEPWFRSRDQLTQANLAVLFQRLGQYKKALAIYSSMSPDPQVLPQRERAQMLVNTGTLYRRLGDPVAAIENYRAAREIYRGNAFLAAEVGALNNIGITQTIDSGDWRAAAVTFTGALGRIGTAGGRRLLTTTLLYRGEAFLRGGQWEQAAQDFEAAQSAAAATHSDEEDWRSSYGLARVAAQAGNRTRSVELLQHCVRVIEQMRRATAAAPGRSGFLIDRRDVYDLLIDELASAGNADTDTLFMLMEHSRARDIQDRTGAGNEGLKSLQRSLPADTLLLEYWLGDRSLAILAISRTSARSLYRPLSSSDAHTLRQLPAALRNPLNSTIDAAILLPGGLSELQRPDITHLIVIPDGDIAKIPFEALPRPAGHGELLIHRYAVSYLPFAAAFHQARARRSVLWPWQPSVMAFADPTQGTDGRGIRMEQQNLNNLPHAADEVRAAVTATGGHGVSFLFRDARKQRLLEQIRPVPVLHFATHAYADPEDPARSYILFAPAADGVEGFDYLFLAEAGRIKAAKGGLVVISACDSGTGRIVQGEGVQSFSSAFLAGGASAVLSSLWKVNDRATQELMTRFYRNLTNGDTADAALRAAKLSFLTGTGNSSQAEYWAAFTLAGDSGFRLPVMISRFTLTALGFVVLAAGFGVIALSRRIRTPANTA